MGLLYLIQIQERQNKIVQEQCSYLV